MSQIVASNRRISQRALLLAVGVLALIACTLVMAPAAQAGLWAQITCSDGNEPAPIEGWTSTFLGEQPSASSTDNTCEKPGGSLRAINTSSNEPQLRGAGAGWMYSAPAGSTIAGGTVSYSLQTPQGEAYIATPNNSPSESDRLVLCRRSSCEGGVPSGSVPIGHIGGTKLYATAFCLAPAEGEIDCPATPNEGYPKLNAEVSVYSAEIVLINDAKPIGSVPAGTLLGDPASGNASLSFTAEDQGGPGVYWVTVQIDGQKVWEGTPNLNEGKCVTHGTVEGARAFEYAQPCPQETEVRTEVSTTSIPNGQHQLEIEVEDAAGNTAVVYDGTITIANNSAAALLSPAPVRGPANGTPASESATLTAQWKGGSGKSVEHLTSTYGRSHQITGKLTTAAGGTPIADALIEVTQKPASLGSTTSSITGSHTNLQGNFIINLPPSSSSTSIQLVYRTHLGDATPAATQTLTLQVPASIQLTVSPHLTSVGHTIILSGKLAGPIPPGGKKVLFEARVLGHPWIEFHNATVDAHGRFRATHRFTFPGPVHYQFRVVCEREADFPFLVGNSNIVRVWER